MEKNLREQVRSDHALQVSPQFIAAAMLAEQGFNEFRVNHLFFTLGGALMIHSVLTKNRECGNVLVNLEEVRAATRFPCRLYLHGGDVLEIDEASYSAIVTALADGKIASNCEGGNIAVALPASSQMIINPDSTENDAICAEKGGT
jgi:hypothetical protein